MSDYDDFEERPSKTQLKKEAHAQQALGEELTRLPQARLEKLDLPAQLVSAISEFRRLPNSFGARKRQLQYIGRLMRDCDTEAIREQLAEPVSSDPVSPDTDPGKADPGENAGAELVRAALLDSYCQRILSEGDEAINELLSAHPQLERQRLRQLALAHARANEKQQEAEAQRLYHYLDEVL